MDNLKFDYLEIVNQTHSNRLEECQAPPDFEEFKDDFPYNLPYSLLSSYACYYFEPVLTNHGINPYHWIGITAPFKNIHVIQNSSRSVAIGPSDLIYNVDTILDSIGFSYSPEHAINEKDMQNIGEIGSKKFLGLRIPCIPDPIGILSATVISMHTHVSNSRRWFYFLKENFQNIEDIADWTYSELMELSATQTGISMGYRARYLIDIISRLREMSGSALESIKEILSRDSTLARRDLININYIGPKTADCILLNVNRASSIPPIDVNVQRVCERLNIVPSNLSLPLSSYCGTYLCDAKAHHHCPRAIATLSTLNDNQNNGGCMRAALMAKYEEAGWIQALLFLFGIEICSPRDPKCHACVVGEKCLTKGKPIPIKRRTFRKFRRQKTQFQLVTDKSTGSIKEAFIDGIDIIPNLPTLSFYKDKIETLEKIVKELQAVCFKNKIKMSRQLSAAIRLVALRKLGIPITIQEIAQTSGLFRQDIFRGLRTLYDINMKIPKIQPIEFVDVFCRRLSLPLALCTQTQGLIKKVRTQELNGKSPNGIAAAGLYLMGRHMGLHISQAALSRVSGVSEVTIRNLLKIFNKIE